MAAMIILVDADRNQVEKLVDVDIQDEDWEERCYFGDITFRGRFYQKGDITFFWMSAFLCVPARQSPGV